MSRGHGRVQREILLILMDVPATIADLTGIIFRNQDKKSADSVRRALNRLEADRLVGRHGVNHTAEQCWRFIGVNVDRTAERRTKLAGMQRVARKPKLVRGHGS